MITNITDEYMASMLAKVKPYCMVLLKPGTPDPGTDIPKTIWEHGRRNFALREEKKLCIVAPVTDEGDVSGLYLFNATLEEVNEIMKEDPAVKSGIFCFQVYP